MPNGRAAAHLAGRSTDRWSSAPSVGIDRGIDILAASSGSVAEKRTPIAYDVPSR